VSCEDGTGILVRARSRTRHRDEVGKGLDKELGKEPGESTYVVG
jgi:hypothetical protein